MMRWRILAVAALLAASLAACGGTDTGGGTDQDTLPGAAPTEVMPGGDTGTDDTLPGVEETPMQ